jgi:hypothetical protein
MRHAVVMGLVSACGFAPAEVIGSADVQPDAQVGSTDGGVVARACHSTFPDVRLCLDFDGPTLVEDESSNRLAVSGAFVDTMPRLAQQAAAMSYGSKIVVPESAALDVATVTIEMFVHADAAYDDAYLLDNVYEYTLGISSDALYCDIASHSVTAEATIRHDTWTHVACTYDGHQIRGYVDGELVACRPIVTPIIDANKSGTSIGGGFYGGLDDIHVYARALADADIQALAGVAVHTTTCPATS